jgi:hypothetical protein
MFWKTAGLMLLAGLVVVCGDLKSGPALLPASGLHQEEKQDQEQRPPSTSDFMMVKLDLSRDIVAGLAGADFAGMERSAEELKQLSMESGWNVETTPDYLKLSAEFRGSAERLREAAVAENIDAATLAYFEVTLNCVRCHKYLRDK